MSRSSSCWQPAEAILLYTDGLVEVRGESLSVGLARLRAAAVGDPAPEALCSRVLASLLRDRESEDDVALVALSPLAPADELVVQLPAERSSLRVARHRLRRWLHAAGARDDDLTAFVLAAGEACANAIEHAYPPPPAGFELRARVDGDVVEITVSDDGRWREPRESLRGRGLTIMRAAMDSVDVAPTEHGTTVVLRRRLRAQA